MKCSRGRGRPKTYLVLLSLYPLSLPDINTKTRVQSDGIAGILRESRSKGVFPSQVITRPIPVN